MVFPLKPPFSHGFPMVFPLKPPSFFWPVAGRRDSPAGRWPLAADAHPTPARRPGLSATGRCGRPHRRATSWKRPEKTLEKPAVIGPCMEYLPTLGLC